MATATKSILDMVRLRKSCEQDASYASGGYNVTHLKDIVKEFRTVPSKAKRNDLIDILCVKYGFKAATGTTGTTGTKLSLARPKSPKTKPSVAATVATKEPTLNDIRAEAKTQFPKDKKLQEEYVQNWIILSLPHAEKGGLPTQFAKELTIKRQKIDEQCELCRRHIKTRKTLRYDQWMNLHKVCGNCSDLIGELYTSHSSTKSSYVHGLKGKGVEDILKHGSEAQGYNATMYHGAKYWKDLAADKYLLPDVPSGNPGSKK